MSVHASGGGWQKREGVGPFTTTPGTSDLSLRKAGCPGDRVQEETGPKIRRGGRPGGSRLLPSGSGGESAREDAAVAPFIGTQAGVCCRDGGLQSLGYVSLGFLFTS